MENYRYNGRYNIGYYYNVKCTHHLPISWKYTTNIVKFNQSPLLKSLFALFWTETQMAPE